MSLNISKSFWCRFQCFQKLVLWNVKIHCQCRESPDSILEFFFVIVCSSQFRMRWINSPESKSHFEIVQSNWLSQKFKVKLGLHAHEIIQVFALLLKDSSDVYLRLNSQFKLNEATINMLCAESWQMKKEKLLLF